MCCVISVSPMTNEAESGHLFLGHSHGFFSEVSVQCSVFSAHISNRLSVFHYLLSAILSVSVDRSL